jgi:hypothetical protein
MAEKQELCKCLDVVKLHLYDLARRELIGWEHLIETAGLLDDVAAVEKCISAEDLILRREELRKLKKEKEEKR